MKNGRLFIFAGALIVGCIFSSYPQPYSAAEDCGTESARVLSWGANFIPDRDFFVQRLKSISLALDETRLFEFVVESYVPHLAYRDVATSNTLSLLVPDNSAGSSLDELLSSLIAQPPAPYVSLEGRGQLRRGLMFRRGDCIYILFFWDPMIREALNPTANPQMNVRCRQLIRGLWGYKKGGIFDRRGLIGAIQLR